MARDFDGTDDKLELGSAVVTAPPFTVSLWAMSDQNTALQAAFGIGISTSGTDSFALFFRGATGGDPVGWITRDAGLDGVASTTTGFSIDTWHHVCGREESSTARSVFIDGGSKGTNTDSKTPTVNRTNIGCVKKTSDASFFNGKIAEVVVWNIALTDAEVAALASGVHPWHIHPGNIVGYWPVWGAQSAEPDFSGANGHMTVTGALVYDHPPKISAFDVPRRAQRTHAAGGDLNLNPTGVSATGAIGTLAVSVALLLAGALGTGSVSAVSADRTISISGVSSIAAVGSVTPGNNVALAGVAASGAAGTVTPSHTIGITGVQATGAVGTITASQGADLNLVPSGVSATVAVGTLAPARALGVSGIASTGSPGSLTSSRALPLSGVAGAASVGTVTASTSQDLTLPLTGVAATGAVGSVGSLGKDVPPQSGVYSVLAATLSESLVANSVDRCEAVRPGTVTTDIGG